MRARVPRSRVSQDRWLVSYADFITLLFAFFVVLYAFARADQKKQVQVAQAIDSAFKSMGAFSNSNQSAGAQGAAQPAHAAMGEEILTSMQVKSDLNRIRHDLALTLAKQIASHAVSLDMGRDGLVISLREAGFFDSGSAAPKEEALPTLRLTICVSRATPTMFLSTTRSSIPIGSFRRRAPRTLPACFWRCRRFLPTGCRPRGTPNFILWPATTLRKAARRTGAWILWCCRGRSLTLPDPAPRLLPGRGGK
jgi:hypothetical protein